MLNKAEVVMIYKFIERTIEGFWQAVGSLNVSLFCLKCF